MIYKCCCLQPGIWHTAGLILSLHPYDIFYERIAVFMWQAKFVIEPTWKHAEGFDPLHLSAFCWF